MQEFIEYLESRDITAHTIACYVKYVELFFERVEDVQVTKPDVLRFLEYLKNHKGQQNVTRAMSLTALNHYFSFLLKTEQISKNPCAFLKIRGQKRKVIYKIYTPAELDELFDNYYNVFVRTFDNSRQRGDYQKQLTALIRERNTLILNILVNQGVVTSEIEKIELGDLDLTKATIKIKGDKTKNERTIPLKATQIGLIMNYLHKIRPQLFDLQKNSSNNKLFLATDRNSPKSIEKDNFRVICDRLSRQVKAIDRQFINFQQIRGSVITNWLKANGLRKTQYLAGHKHVTSTEQYQQNNLDGLIDDISKLHPF
jgi:site-specific recombinase XerD